MVEKADKRAKQRLHVREYKILYQIHVSKVTLHFVLGHLMKKQTVAMI